MIDKNCDAFDIGMELTNTNDEGTTSGGASNTQDDELADYIKELLSSCDVQKLKNLDYVLSQIESLPYLDMASKKLCTDYEVKLQSLKSRWTQIHKKKDEVSEEELKEQELRDKGLITDPFDKPVDPAELIETMRTQYRSFMYFSNPEADSLKLVLWTIATWFVEYLSYAPYVMITAPEGGCGKSQLLDMLSYGSYRAKVASDISASALYRGIEAYHYTVFIDEADSFLKGQDNLQGALKAGIRRNAVTTRTEKMADGTYREKDFSVFGFKAVAGIRARGISNLLTSRSIIVKLGMKPKSVVLKRLDDRLPIWQENKSKCARLAQDYGELIRNYRPELPVELSNRQADVWESLISIADVTDQVSGTKYGDQIREIALGAIKDKTDSLGQELLRDIKDIFLEIRNEDEEGISTTTHITPADLTEKLTLNPTLRWADYGKRGLTAHSLGRLLSEYDIRSVQKKNEGKNSRCYCLKDFDPVFERYLG